MEVVYLSVVGSEVDGAGFDIHTDCRVVPSSNGELEFGERGFDFLSDFFDFFC